MTPEVTQYLDALPPKSRVVVPNEVYDALRQDVENSGYTRFSPPDQDKVGLKWRSTTIYRTEPRGIQEG